MLSVVIITHNNFSKKNGCIETVLLSLIKQTLNETEIILVDNFISENELSNLKDCVDDLNIIYVVRIKLILNERNNISSGRNLGINVSDGDIIIFMDDDMVLPDTKALEQVLNISKEYSYGYAANRKWTVEGWYEKHKEEINESFISGEEYVRMCTEEPDPMVRNKYNCRHLLRTYIGNFGFINKNCLDRSGMWDESFTGYGAEDDLMAYRLYKTFGVPALLSNIEAVHIHHKISPKDIERQDHNRNKLEKILHSDGVKIFHTGRLLYGEENVIEVY